MLLSKEREAESQISDKASKYRMELSALEQSNHFILENIKRIKKEIEKLYEEIEAIKLDMQQSFHIIQEKRELIKRTEETINETGIILTKLDEKIKAQIAKKEEISQIHKSFFEKRAELSAEIHNLEK